jgi:hypothetical protein
LREVLDAPDGLLPNYENIVDRNEKFRYIIRSLIWYTRLVNDMSSKRRQDLLVAAKKARKQQRKATVLDNKVKTSSNKKEYNG